MPHSIRNNMKKKVNKLKTSCVSASFIVLLAASFTYVNAQENNSPEARVESFYRWYLREMAGQHGSANNKTVTKSYVSIRFSRWYYSKAGQNLDYNVFLSGQEWNEAWADSVNVGKATIKGNSATVKLTLGGTPDDWIKRLNISLVKEAGKWKIDRVKDAQ